MQSPPPFEPRSPQKPKSKLGLIVAIIITLLIVCCGLPGLFIGTIGKEAFGKAKGFAVCGISATDQRDALLAYADDHDGKLPKADHWQDEIVKYVPEIAAKHGKSKSLQVPGADSPACDAGAGTVLFFNRELSGKKVEDLEKTNPVILFEKFGTGRNLSEKYAPQDPIKSPKFIGEKTRGWFTIAIDGEADLHGEKGTVTHIPVGKKGSVNIEIDTEPKVETNAKPEEAAKK